jgi:hypothetical protein
VERFIATLLILTAPLHVVAGIIEYNHEVADIWQAGLFDEVEPHRDREAAFWMLAFSPVFSLLGLIIWQAVSRGDEFILRVIGLHLIGIGAIGAPLFGLNPLNSGFSLLFVFGLILLRAASKAQRRHAAEAGIQMRAPDVPRGEMVRSG